jgi:membrane-associated protease RseP (regulator of RpoE activity)
MNGLVLGLGIVLFALGICLSVALHEAGHMVTAKAFGMKVRRYFIGFGPKLWSFRRGETEYGLKAIPLGGFCDIAGMTAMDDVTPAEAPRAMWRFPAWKRVVVMSAGSITHFILGFLILYLVAVGWGLPNYQAKPIVGGTACAAASQDPKTFVPSPCGPGDVSPAQAAGIQAGDEIVGVNGQATNTWTDVVKKVRELRGPNTLTVRRDGAERTVTVNIQTVQRVDIGSVLGKDGNKLVEVGAIGIAESSVVQYGALDAVGGSVSFTGQMFVKTWEGLMAFPQKIPKVVQAIGGGERDPNTPVSVVGASRLGGELVQRGLWDSVLLLLASLNFFVGVFNLLPLLPLDGGHIAVTLYEKVRNWLRRLRGQPAGGPVDYTRLTAVTMAVVFLGGAVVLLTVTADLVNPLKLPQ